MEPVPTGGQILWPPPNGSNYSAQPTEIPNLN